VLTTVDGFRAVLELKATQGLTSADLKQLEFYMHYMNIDVGFLVNFPHDSGFPDVPVDEHFNSSSGGKTSKIFEQTAILGNVQFLSDRSIRMQNKDVNVQIIKVVRKQGTSLALLGNKAASASACVQPVPSFGVTLKGLPCKVCLKQGGFCVQHIDQKLS